MNSPVSRNRSLPQLIREMRVSKEFANLSVVPDFKLGAHMTAPASLAFAISSFHPELIEKPKLHLVVMGANGQDAEDDGRWYATLPWLLGRPDLQVRIDLVGIEVTEKISVSGLTHKQTRVGTWLTDEYPLVQHWAPGNVHPQLAEDFIEGGKAAGADAVILFNPGLEPSDDRQWLDSGAMYEICEAFPIVMLTSFCEAERVTDMWLAKTFGLEPKQNFCVNPFRGFEHIAGAWSNSLWELDTNAKVSTGDREQGEVIRMQKFSEYAGNCRVFEMNSNLPPSPNIGCFVKGARDLVDGRVLGKAIQTPAHGLVIGLETGGFHIIEETCEFGALAGVPVNAALVSTFPQAEEYSFEHVAWAARALVKSMHDYDENRVDEDDGDVEDGATFEDLIGGGDMNEMMAAFLKHATGEDIDPEDFMMAMRLQGGMHGPVHPGWFDLLSSIGWKLSKYKDNPERFSPAFFVARKGKQKPLPVVCENYAFHPDDEEDVLAAEAFCELGEMYPDGVILLFKSVLTVKVEGKYYSAGGYILIDGEWSLFALNVGMTTPGDIVAQLEEGFDFDEPLEKYEDPGAQLARALNCLTMGANPNETKSFVTLESNGWLTFMPG